MSSSKQQMSRRHRLSVVVGAVLVSAFMGVACDETLEATPASDAGSAADGTAGGDGGTSSDASQSTDGTTGNDSSASDAASDSTTDSTTDAPADAPDDAPADAPTEASTDAGSDAAADAGSDALADTGADVDAGPAFCVANPLSADDANAVAIEYVFALSSMCEIGGFMRSGAEMIKVEDCFGVFVRERIGCAGASYATALDTQGGACAGYFVHPQDGATFSNADFDQALIALEAALDAIPLYTAPAERAAFMAAIEASRSTVVTSNASGLTHSTCDGGTDGG